jgi:hypothetical protein
MKTIAIESPYAAREPFTVADHVHYAEMAMYDCLLRGEAPFASHLLYPRALADLEPSQRTRGIEAGIAVSLRLDGAAAYIDLGISSGMAMALGRYRQEGVRCELRRLFTPRLGEALRAGRRTLKEAIGLQ